jgi:methylated-DNA-[protein]-cysteine S-methyltransferase
MKIMGNVLDRPVFEATVFNTRFGWCGVAASKAGVRHVVLPLPDRRAALFALKRLETPAIKGAKDAPSSLLKAVSALQAYFRGDSPSLDFPLDLSDISPFDRRVLKVTKKIPYGATRTYGEVAKTLRKPMAARAVGASLGRNPFPLAVP